MLDRYMPHGRPLRGLVAVLALALMTAPAGADDRGTFSFNWENDIYGGTDRNYTNGVRFSYVSPTEPATGTGDWVAQNIFRAGENARIRRGLAFGHSIFTPEDTKTRAPLPDQHPYAGYVYGEVSYFVQRPGGTTQMAALQVGWVGPGALGETVQNDFHDLIDSDRVNGWDNQLADEPVFVLMYEHKERAWQGPVLFGMEVDLTPHWGLALGTLHVHAKAGGTIRWGPDLSRNDFGPPRVRPALGGGGFFDSSPGFSWYLFAGVEGRAVARNLFLDGNTFRDSPSVDKHPLVGDLQAGLVLQYNAVQLSYTNVARTKEFEDQNNAQQFGTVSLSVKF